MSVPILEAEQVTVRYGDRPPVARAATITVERGECVALVGASGCGKSTLAKAMLGLLPASATLTGSIVIGDVQAVDAEDDVLRRLRGRTAGFVAQNPFAACNPLHSVHRHVAEAWRAHGDRPPRGRVEELLASHGIEDAARRARQRPHQWSGGMLQRATIAAARAYEPPLLIADEPTSALDADLADGILRQLRGSPAQALLLISHDLGQVGAHADRVAVMHDGQIVEFGAAAEVLTRPAHPYTQAFLREQLT